MKKLAIAALSVVLICSLLTGCAGGNADPSGAGSGAAAQAGGETGDGAITMRIAHSGSDDSAYQRLAEEFRDELEKLLPGAVEVKIFPNGQLGTETEYLDGMQMGTLDAAFGGRGSQIDERLDVYNLPFIFNDEAHMDKVLGYGTETRQILDDIFYENGYYCLMNYDSGFRHITANKPIYSVDDVKGLDIRTPNTKVLLDLFTAWGANPTPLDFGETYTALQQGVVNAQENPPELIYTSQFYEVQTHISLTSHGVTPGQMMVGRKFWDGLGADVQSRMIEAANNALAIVQPEIRKKNQAYIDEFRELGLEVIDNVDRDSFVVIAREAYRNYYGTIGEDLINMVIAAGE